MVRICKAGLLKLNFETRPKKRNFPVFAKNFRRPWMKLKIFFCHFLNPWALRVSGMGGYTSKCEKSQNHCTLMAMRMKFAAYSFELVDFFHVLAASLFTLSRFGEQIN
jgi:hypothetical protein